MSMYHVVVSKGGDQFEHSGEIIISQISLLKNHGIGLIIFFKCILFLNWRLFLCFLHICQVLAPGVEKNLRCFRWVGFSSTSLRTAYFLYIQQAISLPNFNYCPFPLNAMDFVASVLT